MACAQDLMDDSTRTTPFTSGDSAAVSAVIKAAKDKDLLKELAHVGVSEDAVESLCGRSSSTQDKAEHSETGIPNIDAGGDPKDRSHTSSSSERDHTSPMPAYRVGTSSNASCPRTVQGNEDGNETTPTSGWSGAVDPSATGDGLGRRMTGDETPFRELKFENEVLRQQLQHAKVARSDLEKENETLKEMLEQHSTVSGSHSPRASDKISPTVSSPKLKPVPLPRKHLDKQVTIECTKQPRLDVTQSGTALEVHHLSTSLALSDEPLPVKPPRRKAAEQKNLAKPPLPPYPSPGKLDIKPAGQLPDGVVQTTHPPSAPSPRQRLHAPLAPSQSSAPLSSSSSSPGINKRITPIKHDSSWITSRYPVPTSVARAPPHITVKAAPPVVPTVESSPANGTSPTKGTGPTKGISPTGPSSTKVSELFSSSVEPGDQFKSKAQRPRKFSFLRRSNPQVLPKTEEAPLEGVVTQNSPNVASRPKKAAKKRPSVSPDHERPASVAENTSYKGRKFSSESPAMLNGSGMSTPVVPSLTSWRDQHKTLEDVEDSGFDGDDGSDDEKGATLKIMPKLKSVPERKATSLDEDAEPDCAQLFEYVFVVGLNSDKGSQPTPHVTYSFPPAISFTGKDAALKAIPSFCFPDISYLKPSTNYRSETFSFILTDVEGARRYGYCRRLLPSGTEPRLPEVFCIVSSYGCFSLYEHILDHVEQRRGVSPAAVFTFLQAIVANRFPKPGRTVSVRCIDIKAGGMETIEFTRPPDSRLEHVDFSILFSTLSIRKIIKLVSAILMERRIILCADSLTRLSSCAHAVMALIYPFVWQHALIPVLPSDLVDFCCSPLPFMMGVLPACLKKMDELDMEEDVLIVDLDKNKFIREVGDEDSILPSKLFKYLESVLGSPQVKLEYQKPAAKRTEQLRADEIVVNSFLLFFTYLYGNYSHYIGTAEQGSCKSTFKEGEFLQSFKSKSTKRFLEAFHRTQMFDHFIAERENPNTSQIVSKGLFDTKLPELRSRLEEIEIFSNTKKRWRPFGKKK